MSRPTHAMRQQVKDDALASLPSQRWRWLFTPDQNWLASVNTTTLREVNAVRMFVGVTLLFALVFVGVVGYALTRCGIIIHLFGWKVFQLLPPPGKLSVVNWRLCEESLATARMLDFASSLFGNYSLLLAAMATVAVGATIGKRLTDTEHVERKELAKKAPIIVPPTTNEHQAMPPVQSMTVNVGDEAVETTKNGELPATVERPAVPPRPTEEPEWAQGDPRGGIL